MDKEKYLTNYLKVLVVFMVFFSISVLFLYQGANERVVELTRHKHLLIQTCNVRQKTIDELNANIYKQGKDKFVVDYWRNRYPDIVNVLEIVYDESMGTGISPHFIAKIIKAESNFNQNAVSVADCVGLMQINYKVWRKKLNIDFNRVFDRRYNIQLGIWIFNHYLEEAEGDYMQALYWYNNGFMGTNDKYVKAVLTQ